MTKRKIIGLGILSLILLLFFGFYYFIKFSDTFVKLKFGLENALPPLHSISSEDSSLIKSSYRRNLSANQIFLSRIRQPITFMNYDSAYNIITFKILTAEYFSLKNGFQVSKETSEETVREAYGQHDYDNYYTFYLHSVIATPAKNIRLKISTDSLTTIARNDSVVCYSVVCKNMSISYGEKEPVDILMEGNELGLGNNIEMHLNIMFLKRKDAVFLIVMSPYKPDKAIDPDLLYNITSN